MSAGYGREAVLVPRHEWGQTPPAPPAGPAESRIDNDAELRAALAVAIGNLRDAAAAFDAATAASARGVTLLSEAQAATMAARAKAGNAGADLAERIARWAEEGGEDPRLGLSEAETAALGRLDTAVATEAAAVRACETLRTSLTARGKQRADAKAAVQSAIYRVVARDMEEAARRVEALRAEADRIEHGVALFGSSFPDGVRAPQHTATARLSPAYHGGGRWPTAQQRADAEATRHAIGAWVRALAMDPEAKLSACEYGAAGR